VISRLVSLGQHQSFDHDRGRLAGRQPGITIPAVTAGLAALPAGRTAIIPVLEAGSFISAVPAITGYLIFQRYLVRGLTLRMGK
jgi:ABC-type glycerol-3-phosphate transport system permease component